MKKLVLTDEMLPCVTRCASPFGFAYTIRYYKSENGVYKIQTNGHDVLEYETLDQINKYHISESEFLVSDSSRKNGVDIVININECRISVKHCQDTQKTEIIGEIPNEAIDIVIDTLKGIKEHSGELKQGW